MTAVAEPMAPPTPDFRSVSIGAVHESKTNPRRHFDEAALKELSDSIREKGVLIPLLVRHRGANGAFELVAGARRLRAARAAGLDNVPVLVRDFSDQEALEVQVIENLQRADVHPLEEAEGYRQLLAKHDYTADVLAAKVGKSLSYIYQRLKLSELIEPAKQACFEDKITAGHAILLARLQPKQQAEALKECVGNMWGRTVSVRDLARWIDGNVHLDLHAAPWQKDDATLRPLAGACVSCPKRTGFQPALFPDIAKKDTCTDPGCYQGKQQAFLGRRLVELKAKHGKVIEVATSYSSNSGRNVLPRGKWKEAKKGSCTHVQVAIVADGSGGEIGRQIYICANGDCTKHRESWERSGRHQSVAQAASEQRRKREHLAKLAARREAFEAIVAKAPANLALWDLQFLARMLVKEMHHDALKRLCDIKGWRAPKSVGGWNYGQAVGAEINKASAAALPRMLFELALAPDLAVETYLDTGKRIREAGAHFRVDPVALERRAIAKAKEKASAKKQAKAK